MATITNYLAQSDNLRFKLLAITGKDQNKKDKIIDYLVAEQWTLVDVGRELINLNDDLETYDEKVELELVTRIKEWFNGQPNYLVLTNASILYHELFLKMSPVGAFKYNSRNKNCVIFLEDETRLGNRLYYGQVGSDDYFDQDIRDILLVDIDDIDDLFVKQKKEHIALKQDELDEDAIGRLFQFQQIKDVIDIDSDIKENENRVEIVSSYVISESLEKQICEFFENLERPDHKANTIIGNYGSGKSHLISFLVSLISWPELSKYLHNEKIKHAVAGLSRKFYTVQFELQAVQVPLRVWFFDKILRQLKNNHHLEMPEIDLEIDYDDKENIQTILAALKKHDPTAGLLVVIDEVSDFLASKQQEQMKADLQFLRVIGQVCMDSDQDIMFIGSMQEDIFSSPKFKNVAAEFSRVAERFIPVIIHREDVEKVISSRIVPKTKEQHHLLESKLAPFAEKIDLVSNQMDSFVDLFPLTPFLINAFNDLPYFEKRGVIQFATNEVKYLLNKKFPYFITFERIYDILANSPDKKNLEEISSIAKVMEVLRQKIALIETKYQEDALKISKALAVYSLWPRYETGTTPKELADHLMLLPSNKLLSTEDHISIVVKKIREVTDQQYIKTFKDENSGKEYFKLETRIGIDPEEKISQKVSSVSEDEVESEYFRQLARLLELNQVEGHADVFDDICEWKSVNSFRSGYIFFCKKGSKFKTLPAKDYSIIFISPYITKCNHSFSDLELTIKIPLPQPLHVEQIKEIVAIKNLINSNFQAKLMEKKLEQRINGFNKGATTITGVRYRLATLFKNESEIFLNGKKEHLKTHQTSSHESVPEILDDLKISIFDKQFSDRYPLHPKYAIKLSKGNIQKSLSDIAADLIKGNLNDIASNTRNFLKMVDMIEKSGFPNAVRSKIASQILNEISKNNTKVTDINKELLSRFCTGDYGLEKEFVYLILILLTLQAKIYLQATGGNTIDINNIGDKFKSLAMFETVNYARNYKTSVSYDFAQRFLYNIGLNGAGMSVEEERLTIFNEYKTKVHELISQVKKLDAMIHELRQKHHIYINLDEIDQHMEDIREIDWTQFNITNHTQFSTIEDYLSSKNIDAESVKLMLEKLANTLDALKEYNQYIHSGVAYADDALDLLEKNIHLISDSNKLSRITAIKAEIVDICTDTEKFLDRSHRNPVKGKIDQFKKIYIYDLYLPLHRSCVGDQLEWNMLEAYTKSDTFKRLNLLKKLQCTSESKLNAKIAGWQDLYKYRCMNHSLDEQLEQSVKCSKCSFPDNPQDDKYKRLRQELESIDETLDDFLEQFEEKTVKEIRQYRDNIQYLENDASKKIINEILSSKKLPETLDQHLIKEINQLFKEIDVVELDARQDIIEKIFPDGEMITFEELRKAFLTIEGDIRKNRDENSIRIKLKN
ncbi:MAG: hypothetical protein HQK65_07055 [Desulfamplus sp.]|nr:hypothetical protein [Desulfamplus sp.]